MKCVCVVKIKVKIEISAICWCFYDAYLKYLMSLGLK